MQHPDFVSLLFSKLDAIDIVSFQQTCRFYDNFSYNGEFRSSVPMLNLRFQSFVDKWRFEFCNFNVHIDNLIDFEGTNKFIEKFRDKVIKLTIESNFECDDYTRKVLLFLDNTYITTVSIVNGAEIPKILFDYTKSLNCIEMVDSISVESMMQSAIPFVEKGIRVDLLEYLNGECFRMTMRNKNAD